MISATDSPYVPTRIRALTQPALTLTAEQLRKARRIYGVSDDDELLELASDAARFLIDHSGGYVYGSGARYEATATVHGISRLVLPRYPFDSSRAFSLTIDGVEVSCDLDWGDNALAVATFTTASGSPTRVSGDLIVTWPAGGADRLAKRYVQLLSGHWYEHREASTPLTLRTLDLACDSMASALSPINGGLI